MRDRLARAKAQPAKPLLPGPLFVDKLAVNP